MPLLAIFDFDFTVTLKNTDQCYWDLIDPELLEAANERFESDPDYRVILIVRKP